MRLLLILLLYVAPSTTTEVKRSTPWEKFHVYRRVSHVSLVGMVYWRWACLA